MHGSYVVTYKDTARGYQRQRSQLDSVKCINKLLHGDWCNYPASMSMAFGRKHFNKTVSVLLSIKQLLIDGYYLQENNQETLCCGIVMWLFPRNLCNIVERFGDILTLFRVCTDYLYVV